MIFFFFFFNDTATTEIYTLSLHDALPILSRRSAGRVDLYSALQRKVFRSRALSERASGAGLGKLRARDSGQRRRSEEHTSELQSLTNLVCRLLLEKKKKLHTNTKTHIKNI